MAGIGMPLDPWQQTALGLMLGERADGKWSAFEFGLIVARQNGKGGVLEARELAGLFLFGERLIIHSAHQFDTSLEAFVRMKNLIDGSDWLSKQVDRTINSHGEEGFVLKSGQRLRYRARTKGGGRGFSGDCVILDEAQNLSSRELAALMPTLSARPNPQIIYTGTVLPEATVFKRIVDRGRAGAENHMGYAEWSAPEDADVSDPKVWAQANPALGIRISLDYVAAERAAFGEQAEAEFKQERLSIWPDVSELGSVIPVDAWNSATDSTIEPPSQGELLSVGVAISPDRKSASVGYAWHRDGRVALDVVQAPDVDWVLPYLVEKVLPRKAVVCVDQGGPAATLLVAMGAAGLDVRTADTTAYKTACASFVDGVRFDRLRHRGQPELTDVAIRVKEHKTGDSWVFARRDSGIPIDPLEAVTLAAWGLSPDPKRKEFFVYNLNDFVADE